MKSVSLLTTSLLLLAATAEAADHDERLNYTVKILGSSFAKATMYSSDKKIFGEIKTNKKWDAIFLMDNKIASVVDEQFFPVETELQLCTKKKNQSYEIAFGEKMIKVLKDINGTKYKKVKKCKQKTHDLMSWIYNIRNKVGDNKITSFKVFSGNKLYDVNVNPLPEEEILTPLGAKKAVPYQVVVTRPLKFRQEITMWFGTQGNHIPLKAVGTAKLGKFEIMIETIEKREVKDVQLQ